MADASDSKSDEGDFVRVQVPPSAFLGRGALYEGTESLRLLCWLIRVNVTAFFLPGNWEKGGKNKRVLAIY